MILIFNFNSSNLVTFFNNILGYKLPVSFEIEKQKFQDNLNKYLNSIITNLTDIKDVKLLLERYSQVQLATLHTPPAESSAISHTPPAILHTPSATPRNENNLEQHLLHKLMQKR